MLNQSDLQIQTNLDTLTQFRSRQTDNLEHYKKATSKLNHVLKEVKSRLQDYQSLVRRKERLPRPVELHHGFSWYIDQDEIWRFFIDNIKSEFNNLTDEKILELIKMNYEELEETFRKCNKEKIALREQLKFLEYYLKVNDPSKHVSDDAKYVKIDLKDVEIIKKKYQIKFFNDFFTWESNTIIEIEIPKMINRQLDKIFRDDVFLFQEFQTYDPDTLEREREGLGRKLYMNINDYILKEYGAISKEKIDELIQIQLSTLLKSYKIPPRENKHLEKVPSKGLKKIARDACEKLIENFDESDSSIEENETQRDKIRKFLKENYPNFINDPANETNLAKEFVDLTYSTIQGRKKKNVINSVRIEMIGMKKGEISLDINPKNSK